MEVKSVFLNRVLEGDVYVDQPARYVKEGKEDKVYNLKRIFL